MKTLLAILMLATTAHAAVSTNVINSVSTVSRTTPIGAVAPTVTIGTIVDLAGVDGEAVTNIVNGIMTNATDASGWALGQVYADNGSTSITNTGMRWYDGHWEMHVVGTRQGTAFDHWVLTSDDFENTADLYLTANSNPCVTKLTVQAKDLDAYNFDGNEAAALITTRPYATTFGFMKSDEVATAITAATTGQAATNLVRSIAGRIYDEPLVVLWEQRMVNGNLYYIAVTNVNLNAE